MNILDSNYWISCKKNNDIRKKFKKIHLNTPSFFKNKKNLKNFIILILYIRDKDYGLGMKDISRWMLLELELLEEGVIFSLFECIPIFGYWKDFNLILLDIYGDNRYSVLENQIYDYLKQTLMQDINNYNDGYYSNISLLSKYIGKERKSLDKKTGFTRKFVLELYPGESLFKALKKFRRVCQKINKIKETEKNKDNNKMKSDFFKNKIDSKKITFVKILNNINQFPKYTRSERLIDNLILNTNQINTIKFKKKYGNYLYHDNLIKTLDEEYNSLNLNCDSYCNSPYLSNWEEFTKYQSLFNDDTNSYDIDLDYDYDLDNNSYIENVINEPMNKDKDKDKNTESEEKEYLESERKKYKDILIPYEISDKNTINNINSINCINYSNNENINVNVKKSDKSKNTTNKLNLFIRDCENDKNTINKLNIDIRDCEKDKNTTNKLNIAIKDCEKDKNTTNTLIDLVNNYISFLKKKNMTDTVSNYKKKMSNGAVTAGEPLNSEAATKTLFSDTSETNPTASTLFVGEILKKSDTNQYSNNIISYIYNSFMMNTDTLKNPVIDDKLLELDKSIDINKDNEFVLVNIEDLF